MIKIKILSVGKTRESWLEEALAEYFKRLSKSISFECLWAKDDAQLEMLAEKENNIICLDPSGKLMTSEEFAGFLERRIDESGSRLTFIIGGPEGLTPVIKKKGGKALLSLSPLTFTHQLTRLVLVEQIYRSIEILKGSKYHKGS